MKIIDTLDIKKMNAEIQQTYADIEETLDTATIYLITNKVDGKQYVGEAKSYIRRYEKFIKHGIEGRFKEHCRMAIQKNSESCPKFYNAIRKHGVANFSVKLLLVCKASEAFEKEAECIIKYDSIKTGYNIHLRYNFNNHDTQYGLKRIDKIRKTCKEKWNNNPEFVKKATDANLEAVLKRAKKLNEKNNRELPTNIVEKKHGYAVQIWRNGKLRYGTISDENKTDAEKLELAKEMLNRFKEEVINNIEPTKHIKKLDHMGNDLPKRLTIEKGGYRVRYEKNGKVSKTFFTDMNKTMDEKLKLAKEYLLSLPQNK